MVFTARNAFRLQRASKIFGRSLAARSAWKMTQSCPCSLKTEQATKIYENYSPRPICGAKKGSAWCDGTSCRNLPKDWSRFWVAHASRVLVSAWRRNNLSKDSQLTVDFMHPEKFAMARTPSPTRETRVLPRRARIGLNC